VAAVVTRVVTERAGKVDQLEGLRRIGIDEISYRKGHRYLTVVVDHDTGGDGVGPRGPQLRNPREVLHRPRV